MVHVIHPVHGDQEEGDAVGVREVAPGHVDHLVMGSPAPAMVILSLRIKMLPVLGDKHGHHHQGCGLGVAGAVHGGQMEDVGPGHLPQHWVGHRHIEPVVSARMGDLGEAGLAPGAGGRPHTHQGHKEEERDQAHGQAIRGSAAE